MNKTQYLKKTFELAAECRYFELNVFKNVEEKIIKFPVYLSAGQEFISASLSTICKQKKLYLHYFLSISVIRYTSLLVETKKN